MEDKVSDFGTLFWKGAQPYERAHMALKKFSATGDTELAEAASFGILLKSAADTHGTERFRLSAPKSQSAELLLSRDKITLSAIGMSRNDIASDNDIVHGSAKKFPLVMSTRDGLTAPEVNFHADEDILFEHSKWEQKRLSALETSLSQGSNIICFGENDFPPEVEKSDIESYCRKIQTRIDSLDRPIFLVVGTAHDRNHENKTCYNQARIFVNDYMQNLKGQKLLQPILHQKLNSAERTKEKISVPERPIVTYYDTTIGKIAVLICVDAYNPTVLMSLLGNRANRGEEQIDYVLVPSYNRSPKLYYSCQVLSLISGCVVMLVDACSESSKGKKPAETAVFVHGRLFSDLVKQCPNDIGKYITSEPHSPIRTCEISLDYLRELRSKNHPATPFLNEVSENFSSLIYHNK